MCECAWQSHAGVCVRAAGRVRLLTHLFAILMGMVSAIGHHGVRRSPALNEMDKTTSHLVTILFRSRFRNKPKPI